MSIEEIFNGFETTPYLFIGSGLSRRYYGLPNWSGLLEHFCAKVSNDNFKFPQLLIETSRDYAKIGQRINDEYNKKWFEDPTIRSGCQFVDDQVQNMCSPFKAEIAWFIKNQTEFKQEFNAEIEALKRVLQKNVSGVVTTNYDKLIENIAPKYNVYSSQNELITSKLYGIGELYKIHGDIDSPSTIVITENDYNDFESKYKYLAAKLLTIFSEFPVVFIGYSLSDQNIRKILQEMSICYPDDNLRDLASRLVIVSYKKDVKFNSFIKEIDFGANQISMTVIETDDFLQIYNELEKIKSGYPVHILRKFQMELYEYVVTGQQKERCYVEPYDESISEESIIFSIGIGKNENGLVGVSVSDWYYDVLFDKFNDFSPDRYLKIVYPRINCEGFALPVFKLLSKITEPIEDCNVVIPESYEALLVNSDSNWTYKIPEKYVYRSIEYLEKNTKSLKKETQFNYISNLKEEEFDVDYLGDYLRRVYVENKSYINNGSFKRLIRIYDWLKYRPIYLERLNQFVSR